MGVIEETIDATLDLNGQLQLSNQPRLPPGPVRVTIRVVTAIGPQRGLADGHLQRTLEPGETAHVQGQGKIDGLHLGGPFLRLAGFAASQGGGKDAEEARG